MSRLGGLIRGAWDEYGFEVQPWMVLLGLFLAMWFVLHNPLPWLWHNLSNPTVVIVVAAAIGLPVYLEGAKPKDDQ